MDVSEICDYTRQNRSLTAYLKIWIADYVDLFGFFNHAIHCQFKHLSCTVTESRNFQVLNLHIA